jgi:hypothetical protein
MMIITLLYEFILVSPCYPFFRILTMTYFTLA